MDNQGAQQGSESVCQVRIELLRVQGFLFAVPRLRFMIGANVLLGETVRNRLREAAVGDGSDGSRLTLRADHPLIQAANDSFPQQREDDPLTDTRHPDDPRQLVKDGILVRDGGHFIALFEDGDKAKRFRSMAESILRRCLPGLRFEIMIERFGVGDRRGEGQAKGQAAPQRFARTDALVELPVFETCRESGNGPAQATVERKSNGVSRTVPVSHGVGLRKKEGDRFFSRGRTTEDIIGLMRSGLPLQDRCTPPKDLEALCGDDELAVIHADGNRVGMLYKNWRDGYRGDSQRSREEQELRKEGHGEHCYHHMRTAVRRAVVDALGNTFRDFKGEYLPYQLLMLGGDDLLMVCRARYALPFLTAYARGLENAEWGKKIEPLTIGAGVAIGHYDVPFHRLYGLAEDLASSAKRLHRGLVGTSSQTPVSTSTVDWLIFSESWAEDPIGMRRMDYHIRYRADGGEQDGPDAKYTSLALTRRPYPILDGTPSLKSLLDAAAKLCSTRSVARSQLRGLAEELSRGRRWAELRWREMPEETRRPLEDALQAATGEKGLWVEDGGGYQTVLTELIELYELKPIKVQLQEVACG